MTLILNPKNYTFPCPVCCHALGWHTVGKVGQGETMIAYCKWKDGGTCSCLYYLDNIIEEDRFYGIIQEG